MSIIISVLHTLHVDPYAFWFEVVLFFVLHFSLNELIYKPMLKKRNERDKRINGTLAEAEKLTATARGLRDDYEHRLRAARHDGQAQVSQAVSQAEKKRSDQLTEARARATALLEEARATVAREREKAMESFDDQVQTLSLKIAERLLHGSLPESDCEKFLVKMRGTS